LHGVVLDAESIGNASLEPIMALADDWQIYQFSSPEQVAERIRDADLVLSNKAIITGAALAQTQQLKLVAIMATGTNNIDIEAAHAKGVTVCNAQAYGTPAVAQHTMTLMLNLATQMPNYLSDVTQGKWQKSRVFGLLEHPIIELSGKTLGIIGKGELGRAVAKLGEAFGMQVLISARPGQTSQTSERVPFRELLGRSDFLSLHCPLTPENRQLMNSETLALLSPESFLINTSRGGLVDSKALINAITNGKLAGAALDTLDIEPPLPGDPLISAAAHLPNLLITPHNAWGAIESRQRLVLQVAENIRHFFNGTPRNVVSS
jgi:glycerate dehydrogenase